MNEANKQLRWLTPREDLGEDKVYQVYAERLNQIFGIENKDDEETEAVAEGEASDGAEASEEAETPATDKKPEEVKKAKDNQWIRNIAVVGDLGSGKSSLLRTFSKKNDLNFMFISLVDLESCKPYKEKKKNQNIPDERMVKTGHNTSDSGSGKRELPFGEKINIFRAKPEETEDRETVQKRLECSILRQLLSYCRQEDLRSSSLKAIPEPRKIKWIAKLQILFMGSLGIGLLFHQRFGNALRSMGLSENWSMHLHNFGRWLFVMLLLELGHYLWKEQKMPLRLEKLTLKHDKAEAEFAAPDSRQHCLEVYNFEMIHILEQIAHRHGHTVVFEDMERFGPEICVTTMTKLWELNKLLNTHLQTLDPEAEPVRFVYAISDQILDAENRVKYFDVVLPVLPALNNANCTAVFNQKLMEMETEFSGNHNKLMDDLIMTLSDYLTDYRQMLSALNEFALLCDLYKLHTKKDAHADEDAPWLLAFAAVKTLYPEYCYGIFSRKVSDDLPDDMDYPLIRKLRKNGLLTMTNLMMILFQRETVYKQWIHMLSQGDKHERLRKANRLKKQLEPKEGKVSNPGLEGIRGDSEFQKLLFNSPSPAFTDVVKDIITYNGIFKLGYKWILPQAKELSGSNAFCSCMYLLNQDEERSSMSNQEKSDLRKWCRKQLDDSVFSLSGSWYYQENVDVVKKIATEILKGPNGEWSDAKDEERVDRIDTPLKISLPADAPTL